MNPLIHNYNIIKYIKHKTLYMYNIIYTFTNSNNRQVAKVQKSIEIHSETSTIMDTQF